MSTEEKINRPDWPEIPNVSDQHQFDLSKCLYTAKLEAAKLRWRDEIDAEQQLHERENQLQDQAAATEDRLREAVHAAYLDVARGTLDRALKRADMVIAASSAIGTTYSGLLALTYSLSTTPPRPLSPVALAPAVFLGLSLLFSALYAGFMRRKSQVRQLLPGGTGASIQERRLGVFIAWTNATALRRAWALRAAVVSLGVGVALLPLPFVDVSVRTAKTAVITSAVMLLIWLVFEAIGSGRKDRNKKPSAAVRSGTTK